MGKEGIRINAGEVEITIRLAENAKKTAMELAGRAKAEWDDSVERARRAGHG